MKSNVIAVSGEGLGVVDALALTEKIGREQGLDHKSLLHLRLLGEELFGMLRGIAGDVRANYWLVYEGRDFELHMKSDVSMTDEMKKQFLAASSGGKNEAAKGFMGKLRVMIAAALVSAGEAMPYAMMNSASAYSMGLTGGEIASVWSLSQYAGAVRRGEQEKPEVREAWDELEKSIVANIANDVKVKILGSTVEITVVKSF